MSGLVTPAPKAKGGRPRVLVQKPGVAVATWITPDDYDKLIKAAKAREQSVSQLVRTLIKSF